MLLEIGGSAGVDLDRVAGAVPRARFVKRREGLLVAVGSNDGELMVRALAYEGVTQKVARTEAQPGGELIPAVGRGLAPISLAYGAVDVIEVARLPLGAATRAALGRQRPWWWPHSSRRVVLCRALLRMKDQLLAWERRLWLPRSEFTTRAVRRIARPVVFDRSAIDVQSLGHIVRQSAGALSRWAR